MRHQVAAGVDFATDHGPVRAEVGAAERSVDLGQVLGPSLLLHVQRAAGNAAVSGLLASLRVAPDRASSSAGPATEAGAISRSHGVPGTSPRAGAPVGLQRKLDRDGTPRVLSGAVGRSPEQHGPPVVQRKGGSSAKIADDITKETAKYIPNFQ